VVQLSIVAYGFLSRPWCVLFGVSGPPNTLSPSFACSWPGDGPGFCTFRGVFHSVHYPPTPPDNVAGTLLFQPSTSADAPSTIFHSSSPSSTQIPFTFNYDEPHACSSGSGAGSLGSWLGVRGSLTLRIYKLRAARLREGLWALCVRRVVKMIGHGRLRVSGALFGAFLTSCRTLLGTVIRLSVGHGIFL